MYGKFHNALSKIDVRMHDLNSDKNGLITKQQNKNMGSNKYKYYMTTNLYIYNISNFSQY